MCGRFADIMVYKGANAGTCKYIESYTQVFGISNYMDQTAEEIFLQALYPSRNGKKQMAQQNLVLKV